MNTQTNPLSPFQSEAIARATEAGYFPARFQRGIDWFHLICWVEQVAQPEFTWRGSAEGVAPILVSAGNDGRIAIHSGQHRILAGLIAGKPVPTELLETIAIVDPTRDWNDTTALSTDELLDLLK